MILALIALVLLAAVLLALGTRRRRYKRPTPQFMGEKWLEEEWKRRSS